MVCSNCYHEKQYCDMCSLSVGKRYALSNHVDFLASYFSDMFADHYTGDKPAPGYPPPEVTAKE